MSSLVKAYSNVAMMSWQCRDIYQFSSFHCSQCRGDVATLDGCYSLTVGSAFDVATLSYTVAILT